MAEMNNSSIKGGRKGRPTRMNLRVDFTPMVDMNMLLITFFMFCTTLSKPQSMDLTVPTKDKVPQPTLVTADNAVTLILGENNKIYYYFGKANYKDYTSLKSTSYDADGLRKVLLQKNALIVKKINFLKSKYENKKISAVDFKNQSTEIRKSGELVVMIKPTDAASYDNLVKVLDEMHICNIGKYNIMDVTSGDEFLMGNLKKKGALSS